MGRGYASAVSALTTTAPPLAAVVSFAGIGGLYLTAPPGAGPARVGLVLVVMLATCLVCVLYAISRRPRTSG